MKPIHQSSGPVHRALSLAALVAVAALAQMPAHAQTTASPAGASPAMASPMGGGSGASSAGAHDMQGSMTSGMAQMQQMKMTGDADKDFAAMMKMHHQQGIEMAKAELQHGKSPGLKAMARKIVKDQTQEIGKLDAWMKKHP